MRAPWWTVVVVAVALGLAGCTNTEPNAAPAPVPTTPAATEGAESSPSPAATPPSGDAEPSLPPVPDRVSLPALMRKDFDGRRLRLGQELLRTDAYTRYAVTYVGGGLTISGIMNVPTGKGPFPVVVLNHGYIDPAIYFSGQGLPREQDYLARQGFVVLHTDYRNHAGSDADPANDRRLRLGYTEDTINAVLAVKSSPLRFLDAERVAMLGRSMGGGVTLNALVVAPGIVDAAVVYASVSSDTWDNHLRWTRPGRDTLAAEIEQRHGTRQTDPAFWRGVSPRTYFDRVTEPVLVHHGTVDDSCPISWADDTVAALEEAGARVRYEVYPGEPHTFEAGWTRSIERTVTFLRRHLA